MTGWQFLEVLFFRLIRHGARAIYLKPYPSWTRRIANRIPSITLSREKGETDTLLRKDIETVKASSKSMMPVGLEKEVTVQDMAHLPGFLRESFGKQVKPGIVLFDDEPSFVKALVDGDGTATLNTTDKFSGQASLRMTPLQRHSRSISGWNFRIVEKPRPGEFRYLRFAWKSTGAKGVLIELAASGAWHWDRETEKPPRPAAAFAGVFGYLAQVEFDVVNGLAILL